MTDEARDRQTVAAISASWPHDKKADLAEHERKSAGTVSRHHDCLIPVIGFLAGRTSDEHIVALLTEAAEQAGDQDFLTGRDWRSEIERLVASSSEKRSRGEKVVGLPTLGERFPALADVLRALWPDPTFEFDLEEGESAASTPGMGESPWPEPLAAEAYYGLLGDVVRAIAPTTESDPAALFAHLIVGTGVLLGRHTGAMVGSAPHPPKFNAVVVGKTSQGRKGTAQRAGEGVLLPGGLQLRWANHRGTVER